MIFPLMFLRVPVKTINDSGILRYGLLFFGVLCLLASLAGGLVMHNRLGNARATRLWPTVPGEILWATVATTRQSGEDRYASDVTYSYHVDTEIFIGRSLRRYHTDRLTRAEAERDIDGLQPGRAVMVYYNPTDPSESVVIPGASAAMHLSFWGQFRCIPIGAFMIGMVIYARRHRIPAATPISSSDNSYYL